MLGSSHVVPVCHLSPPGSDTCTRILSPVQHEEYDGVQERGSGQKRSPMGHLLLALGQHEEILMKIQNCLAEILND
ncbi:hypothetical protein KUCAC02_030791 [Chaenocephalus aceratus]|uniref:Uncharacterized protein n=1 Tax=Chaenocephalus aceratus TaxID=36190 RepID=A0ACB9XJT1_CHAAC|nr:hypothetical protein KUCAC02_030791 [Chaenocephalus aceratus]